MPIIPGLQRVRGRYDLVFGLGFPFTTFSYAAYRTARASGAPLVLTPFLHLSTPGDAVNRHYTRPHQVRLLAEADLVVVQTEIEADAVRSWGVDPAKVRTLGMAVRHDLVTGGDRPWFRDQIGIRESDTVVGYLGVSDPNKGTVDLVRAVAQLNARRAPDAPIRLVLGGNSSPDFERFLGTLDPARHGWLTRLGPLPSAQVRHFYAALDLFAMPSRTDSFGIVFLEAWANRLPVVAAAAGGVSEVVEDGATGLLVPFGDLDRLAGALGRIIEDPALAQRLGRNGHERVAQGHGWDDRYATLCGWVHGLLGEGDRAGRSRVDRLSRASRTGRLPSRSAI